MLRTEVQALEKLAAAGRCREARPLGRFLQMLLYGTRAFLQATLPAELRIFVPRLEATAPSEQAIEATLDEIT
eukprot:7794036-Alexandrium_andersonii.AAC.1